MLAGDQKCILSSLRHQVESCKKLRVLFFANRKKSKSLDTSLAQLSRFLVAFLFIKKNKLLNCITIYYQNDDVIRK
jgi:hypothetical protein